MTVVAQDTKNEFADAWNGEPASARPADIGTDPNAPDNAYREAWNRENRGIYGDINLAPVPPPVTSQPGAAPSGFRQQTVPWSPQQQALLASGRNPWMLGGSPEGWLTGPQGMFRGDGGYGSFTYGMDVKAGSPEYRDMQEYMLNGGYDPYGIYGERKFGSEYADAWNHGGGNSGNSVGGSAAADGSGGGSPGAL